VPLYALTEREFVGVGWRVRKTGVWRVGESADALVDEVPVRERSAPGEFHRNSWLLSLLTFRCFWRGGFRVEVLTQARLRTV
jgi:hypothetical protein